MTDTYLLTQIIARLDRNQMALQAALEEVAIWITQQGGDATGNNITNALQMLNENADFIAQGVAELTVSSQVNLMGKNPT